MLDSSQQNREKLLCIAKELYENVLAHSSARVVCVVSPRESPYEDLIYFKSLSKNLGRVLGVGVNRDVRRF
jgi:hypothetical protein